MAPRGGSGAGPANATRYTREFLARMGLPPDASDEDIESTLDAAAEFLRGAPPRLIRWARHEIAALERGTPLLGGATAAGLDDGVAAIDTDRAGWDADDQDLDDQDPDDQGVTDRADRADRDRSTRGTDPDIDPDDLEDLDEEDIDAAPRPPAATDRRRSGRPGRGPAGPGTAPRTGPASGRAGRSGRPRRGAARTVPDRGTRPGPDEAALPPLWRSRSIQVLVVLVLLVGAGFGIWWSGKGSAVPGINGKPTDTAAGPSAVPVDPAKLSALMQKIQANPKDVTSLQAVADLYFAATDYKNSAVFEQKVLAVAPKNISALMGLAASEYNVGNLAEAKKSWLQAIAVNPKLTEAHYNLGFLYMSQSPPDTAAAKAEWDKVVAIDPNSDLAKSVVTHLSALTNPSAAPSSSPSGK